MLNGAQRLLTKTEGKSAPRHAAVFVLITVVLNSVGIGIIMPVTPDLIRELANSSLSDAAVWGGYLSFIYALM